MSVSPKRSELDTSIREGGALDGSFDGPGQAEWRRVVIGSLAVGSLLVVFFVHFRPWDGGLLEEWGFARAWLRGWSTHVTLKPGRPLDSLPYYLGLAISNGGFVGMYFVFGFVAGLQVVFTVWAARPVLTHSPLPWLAGLVIGLHPWWPAGETLRFLPAQVSCLAFVVWLGFSLRYLQSGRRRWLVGVILAPIIGLLTYQALALVFPLVAVPLALVVCSRLGKRGMILLLSTAGPVGLVTIYTVLIAPWLFGNTYESELMIAPIDMVASITAIASTVTRYSPTLILLLLFLMASTVVIAIAAHARRHTVALLILLCIASLATPLTYAGTTLHLNDPERVAFPLGLSAWSVCFIWLVIDNHRLRVLSVIPVGILALASLPAAIHNLDEWSRYAGLQQRTLELIRPVVLDAPPNATIVVADSSGVLGDMYTFFPPYLQVASEVSFASKQTIELCTPQGVERLHVVAQRYPVVTTETCPAYESSGVTPSLTTPFSYGHISVYVLTAESWHPLISTTYALLLGRAPSSPELSAAVEFLEALDRRLHQIDGLENTENNSGFVATVRGTREFSARACAATSHPTVLPDSSELFTAESFVTLTFQALFDRDPGPHRLLADSASLGGDPSRRGPYVDALRGSRRFSRTWCAETTAQG